MADEECVLGIPITNPEVLKATQVVLVCVGVDAFFLILELVEIWELRGLWSLARHEALFWFIDTTRAVVITFSGYIGVKRSSRVLLGCFCSISGFSCLASIVSGAVDVVLTTAPVGRAALRFFAAMFFGIACYFSLFLFQAAGEGVLLERRSGLESGYNLLGIPMMDLRVLKATQLLFTTLGIIVCVLGGFVVISAEKAVSSTHFRVFWLICLGIVLGMSYTAISGVKNSSVSKLTCFSCISAALCMFFALTTLLTALFCRAHCPSALIFNAFLLSVFTIGLRSAWFLRHQAAEGVVLTAPHCHMSSAPPADIVGATELAMDEPPLEADGAERLPPEHAEAEHAEAVP